MNAIIIYNPNGQKTPGLFDQILTTDILKDICQRITGQSSYIVKRDTVSYNKGRLLYLIYDGTINYVTLSEQNLTGRNSSVQSVPTAINLFYADSHIKKNLYYYFVPHTGNPFTDYHLAIYKMMLTAGIKFLNLHDYYTAAITPYHSIDELIIGRDENRTANSSNNSSYVSKTSDKIQIYAKVFGASKYESTLLAIAASKIADRPIDLFNICEQDLSRLPASSITTLQHFGNISIHDTSLTLEKHRYIEQTDKSDLRSPVYQYNLHQRLGHKKCALCGCEIPEIIQGAHIWGVSEIASAANVSDENKFDHAVSGHNGLWLCQNHHKLFDSNILLFDLDGYVRVSTLYPEQDSEFIRRITTQPMLNCTIMSDDFLWYLTQHNLKCDFTNYVRLVV